LVRRDERVAGTVEVDQNLFREELNAELDPRSLKTRGHEPLQNLVS
jgi:hypothetical protein